MQNINLDHILKKSKYANIPKWMEKEKILSLHGKEKHRNFSLTNCPTNEQIYEWATCALDDLIIDLTKNFKNTKLLSAEGLGIFHQMELWGRKHYLLVAGEPNDRFINARILLDEQNISEYRQILPEEAYIADLSQYHINVYIDQSDQGGTTTLKITCSLTKISDLLK